MFWPSRPCSYIVTTLGYLCIDYFGVLFYIFIAYLYVSNQIGGQLYIFFFISFLSHTYYIFYFEDLENLHAILYLLFPYIVSCFLRKKSLGRAHLFVLNKLVQSW